MPSNVLGIRRLARLGAIRALSDAFGQQPGLAAQIIQASNPPAATATRRMQPTADFAKADADEAL
jgi:hypothetical protein